jgi:hypothetical protein
VEEKLPVDQGSVAKDHPKCGYAQRKEGCDRVGDNLFTGSIGIHDDFSA